MRGCDRRHPLPEVAEAVQQRQLPFRHKEALLLVLAVDLGQPLPERGEAAHRHAAVVDAHRGASIGADLAAHDRLALAGSQHVGQRIVGERRDRVEHRLDPGGIGPGPHLVGGGTGAQRQGQRVHDQRLARAGLAGQHGEAGRDRQPDTLDDRQVLDGELGQ